MQQPQQTSEEKAKQEKLRKLTRTFIESLEKQIPKWRDEFKDEQKILADISIIGSASKSLTRFTFDETILEKQELNITSALTRLKAQDKLKPLIEQVLKAKNPIQAFDIQEPEKKAAQKKM